MNEIDNRAPRRPALGRGLAALIPQARPPPNSGGDGVLTVQIERLIPDPQQPRHHFEAAALDELAASIREKGVLQPILVRRKGADYVIVAGERRWRAAQRAGLHEVPALVKDLSESEAFEVALIENLQRQDLSPLEEAEAYRRLIEDHGLTQEQAAARVGKDRSTVANALRLLRLPDSVKAQLAIGALSMGHARALLSVDDAADLSRLAQVVIDERLSVRATEKLVRPTKGKGPEAIAPENPNVRHLREELQRQLGAKVSLQTQGKSGTLQIHFGSLDELDRIVDRLLGPPSR